MRVVVISVAESYSLQNQVNDWLEHHNITPDQIVSITQSESAVMKSQSEVRHLTISIWYQEKKAG